MSGESGEEAIEIELISRQPRVIESRGVDRFRCDDNAAAIRICRVVLVCQWMDGALSSGEEDVNRFSIKVNAPSNNRGHGFEVAGQAVHCCHPLHVYGR